MVFTGLEMGCPVCLCTHTVDTCVTALLLAGDMHSSREGGGSRKCPVSDCHSTPLTYHALKAQRLEEGEHAAWAWALFSWRPSSSLGT